jgi:thiol-disulfide isomerase/thioredoxin
MKKVLCIMAMVALIFLTGCSDSDKVYTELSYDELQTKLDKKVEIFFLDLNQLTDEEYAKIYSKYVVTSTPTTIFISEGLETSTYERIIGAAGYSDIVQSLKTHGYIGD